MMEIMHLVHRLHKLDLAAFYNPDDQDMINLIKERNKEQIFNYLIEKNHCRIAPHNANTNVLTHAFTEEDLKALVSDCIFIGEQIESSKNASLLLDK